MIDLEGVTDVVPTPDDLLRMIAVKRAELESLEIALAAVIAYRDEYPAKPLDENGRAANDATSH